MARRPRDRRQQIVTAASELFRDRGYHNVSVADVASEVGITASALYRHFRSKNDLLESTVRMGLDSLEQTVASAGDIDALISEMSESVSARRGLATLWQREARHLNAVQRQEFRHQLNTITAQVADLIRTNRPELTEPDGELLAFSVLAVFGSVAGHKIALPRRRLEATLARLAEHVARCPLGVTQPSRSVANAGVTVHASRREQLLREATRLFDERGFQSVNIEDIGEAAGTTGPNVYNHFEAKNDLLVTAVTRGLDRRDTDARAALDRAAGHREALDLLLESQITFALEDGHRIGLMTSELDQLPEGVRRTCAQRDRDYLDLWVGVLAGLRPDIDGAEAKIAVSAALNVIANAARTGRLRRRADLSDRLAEIGTALLTVSDRARTVGAAEPSVAPH
ncbi:TetR/AcrR family transcriptional regulator [Rhodococcus sp. NPDC127528]|uniref:TetR/AcrR family transcriptional regulator n=1 Tax=unclassified Rhodococcus (in: high G+C Gram-positive bacteria) TaxID=192944 RepID=UPI003639C0E4